MAHNSNTPLANSVNTITGKVETPQYTPGLVGLPAETEANFKLRCVRCLGIPPPPIKICDEGHLYCPACATVVQYCTSKTKSEINPWFTCDTPLVNIEISAYRFLYSTTSFACPNKDMGCEVNPLGANLARHVAECTYEASGSGTLDPAAGGSGTSGPFEVEIPAWKRWGSRYTSEHKPGDISELGNELINLLTKYD